mgnify:CR=1 FL=1
MCVGTILPSRVTLSTVKARSLTHLFIRSSFSASVGVLRLRGSGSTDWNTDVILPGSVLYNGPCSVCTIGPLLYLEICLLI